MNFKSSPLTLETYAGLPPVRPVAVTMLSTSLPLLRPCRLASLARLLPSRPCSSLPQPEVVIPPRVERGPTDILKALAGTVARDYTAPHYKVWPPFT